MDKPVLVTTKHRGVFFGYVQKDLDLPREITLKQARNCIYWSSDIQGFLGLSTAGPGKDCRIGPAAKSITLYDITSVTPVSDEATKRWDGAVWSG